MTQTISPNFWKDKQVLVTGAGGFIASHLVEALLEREAQVRAFVRYNSRGDPGLLRSLPGETLERVEVVAGDLRDLAAMQEATQGMEVVFHLGALIAEHPLQGQSPYSASKIGADKIAESFYRSYDLPVVTVRPFNTYGPRQSARAVIPTIIGQALTQEVIRLGNLEARRDLTYVSDTVEGFLKAGEAAGVEGATFNLGTGQEVSIGELVQEILPLVGRSLQIEVDPTRLRPEKSEVERLLSDNSLADERLGWQPQVSLREGLRRTIEWMRNHLELYEPGRYQV
ncbi:MAG: GDP-mannose 4,6-dehydratase [Anaerolineales bacterium]